MNERGTDADIAREIGSLIGALEDLQGELDPGDRERRRLPTPRDLVRFTSEVTIPATILVLETNVRILKLLQRTLRMTAGESPRDAGTSASGEAVRQRAEQLGQRTLGQLEGTLDDLQGAIEGRPPNDDAAALLDEARRLRDEIQSDLAASPHAGGPHSPPAGGPTAADEPDANGSPLGSTDPRSTGVDIDVESELQSLKDQVDDDSSNGNDQADDE